MDTFLSVFSLLGSFEVIILVLAGWIWKREGKRKMIVVLAILALGMGIEVLGKAFISHPGPPEEFHRYSLPFSFPSSGFSTGNSFPSGHSFRSVFLTVIALSYAGKNKKMMMAWITFAAVMLISRVSLGEHWTSDVVGGATLGLILGSFSRGIKDHAVAD